MEKVIEVPVVNQVDVPQIQTAPPTFFGELLVVRSRRSSRYPSCKRSRRCSKSHETL